jgi:ABC-type thiamine transport system ATPase subunit
MPQRQNMEQLARARHITATTHIEPSTQGSPSEFSASGEDNSSLAKKAARLRELLDTPGASTDPKLGKEMERLMNETAGRRR